MARRKVGGHNPVDGGNARGSDDASSSNVMEELDEEALVSGVSLRHRGRIGIVDAEEFNGKHPEAEACGIRYDEEYKVLVRMSIYWTRLLNGVDDEVDDAASCLLWLTARLLNDYNAALYTCWQWRRDALRVLLGRLETSSRVTGGDEAGSAAQRYESWCSDELDFAQSIAESNPKNYQVCHHRQEVLSMVARTITGSLPPDVAAAAAYGFCNLEYAFTTRMLSSDAKNYHVWQHRTWITTSFADAHLGRIACGGAEDSAPMQAAHMSLLRNELEFTSERLRLDVRNNSAFQYRSLVVRLLLRLGQAEWVDEREGELRQVVVSSGAGDVESNASAASYFNIKASSGSTEMSLVERFSKRPSQHPFALLQAAVRRESCNEY